jgi:hypothetical protein
MKKLFTSAASYEPYAKLLQTVRQPWPTATPCCRLSMADYNARFAKAPANHKDLHRPLRAVDDLDNAFAWKEERTLSQALTLQSDKVMLILGSWSRANRRWRRSAIGSPWLIIPTFGWRSVTAGSNWRTDLRQNSPGPAGRDRREQTARRGASPLSARRSCAAGLSVIVDHAGAIRATRVSLRSAELFLRAGPADAGPVKAERFRAPAPSDICIWQNQ